MRRIFIITLCFLLILPKISLADNEPVCSAKLLIDNNMVFSWDVTDAESVSIYGADAPGAENKRTVAAFVSAGSGGYTYNCEADGEYDPYYLLVFKNASGEEISRQTVEPQPLVKRYGRKITNISHPYILANEEKIAQTKEKISKYEFYAKQYKALLEAADSYIVTYKDYKSFPQCAQDQSNVPVDKAAGAAAELGIAYVLSGEEKYAEAAEKILLAYVKSYEELEYLHAQRKDDSLIVPKLTEAYDMVYNHISESEREKIEKGYFLTAVEKILSVPRAKLENMGASDWAIMDVALLLKNQKLFDTAWLREPGYGLYYTMINGLLEDSMWCESTLMYHHARTGYFFELAEHFHSANYDLYNHNWTGKRDVSEDAPIKLIEGDLTEVKHKTIREFESYLFNSALSNFRYPYFGDTYTLYNVPFFIDDAERVWSRYGDANAAWILERAYGADRQNFKVMNFRQIFLSKPEVGNHELILHNESFAAKGYNQLGVSVFNSIGQAVMRSRNGVDGTDLAVQWNRYATVGHMHADKLAPVLSSRGMEILSDLGAYTYRTVPRTEYAQHTIAHNTVTVDGISQQPRNYKGSVNEWASDEKMGTFTPSKLEGLAIGPYIRPLSIRNDNVYSNFGVKYGRTFWQADDYVVDMFDVESGGKHTYDYPLTVKGNIKFLSSYMISRAPEERLGRNYGYKHIKSVQDGRVGRYGWESVWQINDDVQFKTTMLGSDDTKVILAKGLSNDTKLQKYDNNILIARRNVNSTVFVNVFDPCYAYENFRTVTELCNKEKVKGISVSGRENEYTDTYIYNKTGEAQSVNGLTADAVSAAKRDENGENTILGMVKGCFVSGKNISVSADKPVTAVLTKMAEGCYRFDMDTDKPAHIRIDGLSGYNVYKMALSDEISLSAYTTDAEFDAEPGGIYILSSGTAYENMEAPYTVRFGDNSEIVETQRVVNEIPEGILIEAEDITEQFGGEVSLIFKGGSHTTNNPGGSSIYNWNNAGHTLKYVFNAPKAGKYKLGIRYATMASDAVRSIKVNNSEKLHCAFAPTGGWNDRVNVIIQGLSGGDAIFELSEGENVVIMENVSGTALNTDYFTFIPTE